MEPEKTLIFCSHDPFFRCPQGAVPAGGLLHLRLLVSLAAAPTAAFVRVWRNGEEQWLPMQQGRELDSCPWGNFLREYTLSWNVSRETSELLWYLFRVDTPSGSLFCVNQPDMLGGIGRVLPYADEAHSFQVTVTLPSFTTPDWAKGAVMYQIFPDRFARLRKDFPLREDQKRHETWEEQPEFRPDPVKGYYPANDFFGGSLNGIAGKLDYLQGLGVSVIYLNPVFAAYSNHRYDTADYETVDPILGSKEDLQALCAAAKKRGIRILLDGVFSHTGSDSRYFNREGTFPDVGAYQSKESPYASWYRFEHFPDKYESWWGVWSLPCVEETDPSFLSYIVTGENSIVRHWLRAGVSGWRLDVADELPDFFIQELRRVIKEEKPDALLLGEVWEDASNKVSYGIRREFLSGNELDTVMNYPLRKALLSYLTKKTDAEAFCRSVLSLRENYPPQSFACLMNFLSTHDTVRALTVLGGAPEKETLSREEQAAFRLSDEARRRAAALLKLGALVLYTMPGMPCLYYGDEAGAEGYADPFNRAPFPWGREDTEMTDWFRALGEQRDEALRRGELNVQGEGALLFIRRQCGNSFAAALVNPTDDAVESMLDRTAFPILPHIVLESQPGAALTQRENGYYLLLPPRGGIMVKCFT